MKCGDLMPDIVIYKKNYSRELAEADDKIMEEMYKTPNNATQFKEKTCFQNIFENMVQVLVTERIEASELFIEAAKEMGEYYQIDTIITKHEDRISVIYAVESGINFPGLKKMIALSDDLNFRNDNGTVLLTLFFYTHATYRSGRRVTPPHNLSFGGRFPRV